MPESFRLFVASSHAVWTDQRPQYLSELMSLVLSGLCWKTCLVYLDDIIVFSQTVEEHLQRLAEVLRRLKDAGLKVKPSKCQLLSRSVQYLEHVVSEKGVEAHPAKISCVRDWPVPDSRESLRRFLGILQEVYSHQRSASWPEYFLVPILPPL